MLKIRLTRNLRRSILRGHPWVYREAIEAPSAVQKAQLCQAVDGGKDGLAWAIYDPHSPLALRILSVERQPPNEAAYADRIRRAWELRSPIRRSQLATDSYRALNGEGDLLPGVVCDLYGETAIFQWDGLGPGEFWDKAFLARALVEASGCARAYEKARRGSSDQLTLIHGAALDPTQLEAVSIVENGAHFTVNLQRGQKTGFFLDQRENRLYLRGACAGQSTLNLFSYTGGFSINAGLGGASRVCSVDLARPAIALAERNWIANGLDPARHEALAVDAFEFLADQSRSWDHVIVDPPSMSHAESGRELAKTKYIELFALSAKRVRKGGELSISSCSSHVSFDDFIEIAEEALSLARRRGRVLRISGQGADHPFPHACRELRYLKFAHLALD